MRGATTWLLAGTIAAGVAAAVAIAHPGHPPIPTASYAYAQGQQSIPFELFRGNRIFIAATINGHRTEVMLDTAASVTSVDSRYARSIALPAGFKVPVKGAGGVSEAEFVTGLTLKVAGISESNASVGVMDLTPIARSIGHPIAVILGRDFFDHSVVSIDWAARRLTISSPDSFKPSPNATSVQLNKVGPFNTIPVSIAGAPPIDALFDVGNGGALSLPRTYWENRPELTALRSADSSAGGVGGMHGARAATIPRVTLAGQTFVSVPAILSDSGSNDDPTQMANVGIGLLQQFKVALDLGHDRVYLTPRTDGPAFARDRAGARFDLIGDRLKASFISKDGPAAAAGLREGDEVVAVDGRAVTPAFYDSGDWAQGAAGRSVILTRANGSKVKVKLADYY